MAAGLTHREREILAAERRTDEYRGFLVGLLGHATSAICEAEEAAAAARTSAKVDAAIAVRARFGKRAVARSLGISRPTLDAWLQEVERTPELLEQVSQHELFVARRLHRSQ